MLLYRQNEGQDALYNGGYIYIMNENEYTKQANDFLKKANATIEIDCVGLAINQEWEEKKLRNLYKVTLSTPRGSMIFNFWDSIYNTKIKKMSLEEYAEKKYKCRFNFLNYSDKIRAQKELKEKKAEAQPTAYDVLACITKSDPGTFENFCFEYGYNEDSRTAERIYFAAQKEYSQLARIFSQQQLEEMQEIN